MKAIRIILVGLGLITAIGVVAWYTIPFYESEPADLEETLTLPLLDTTKIQEPTMYFGYVVDSMEIVHGKIKRNEFLANILSRHNISNDDIHLLSQRVKGVFDIRKIGVRKPYELICYKDDKQTAKAMIYHHNAVDYVIFNLEDSIYAKTGSQEIITLEKTSSGIINNSLAVTMDENGMRPQLTNDLADIFAWEVDFFRLYPGDRFKLIYEEQFVDSVSIGYGDIKGAIFEHGDKKYYAYYFDQGSGIEYFDEEGNSLRKTFLKYPVKFSRISSRYSGRRFHPVQKRYKSHKGTDFAAPQGTPIRAVGDGVITKARYEKYNGNNVKIKHNSVYATQYLHMVKIASGIRPGVKVKQGQTIGYVGHTGLANGNHVCYRFWYYGKQVDAMRIDLPSSEPVAPNLLPGYNVMAIDLKAALDAISYPEEEPPILSGN
ncbi:MAG: peptidase M23 [Bacteroidetes bacterium]|nr:MAG: peptidase M23 [Bacteroidota bacterium]